MVRKVRIPEAQQKKAYELPVAVGGWRSGLAEALREVTKNHDVSKLQPKELRTLLKRGQEKTGVV